PRSGKENKSFSCLKFRSMRVNDKANEQQATKGDARITRIGKILRRTSLDEFPQFLNVLKGDMSVVGPRPHMLKHTDSYSRIIGQYMVRQFL
ncbi:MAG: sugar transferase, partial [Nostoc sp.]